MNNVVLFTIDALRRDMLGSYGSSSELTPFLDSLPTQSLIFNQAHAVAPYTQASFPGILSSSYLFDAPLEKKLSPNRTLISEALREKGITTAAYHSNAFLSGFFGWNRGWDSFYDSMEVEVEDLNPFIKGNTLNSKVDQWLDIIDPTRPFFLWLHYMDVHEPYVPERRYLHQIDPSINLTPQQMYDLFKEVLIPRDVSNPETTRILRKLYEAQVLEVGGYIQQFFEILEKHVKLTETTVIITADHGEEFGEHGSLSHDGRMYSELIHVPLLVVNPPEGRGLKCDTLVSGLDISPTIMRLFGHDPHPDFQGHPLFPLADYPEAGVYGEAIGKLSHKVKETDRPCYYYREKELKIIYREEEGNWELYNLQEDPNETKNLIHSTSEAEELKEKLRPRIGRPALWP